jgi:hypothetical protein
MADKKSLLNMLASIADPELRKLAERIAASIPEDSWLRSDVAERLIGALKGWIESQAGSLGPITGVAVEKISDLMDFATSNLYEKDSSDISGWMNKFLTAAQKRMAATDDPSGECQKIELEFDLLQRLAKVIEEKKKEGAPPTQPSKPIDWRYWKGKLTALDTSTGEAIRNFRRSQGWLRPRRSR